LLSGFSRSTPAAAAPAAPAPAPPGQTVAATCPGCGRGIPLLPHELSMGIECARCGTRFVPAQTGTPTPQADTSPPVAPAPEVPSRSRKAHAYAVASLLLGIAALPVAIRLS